MSLPLIECVPNFSEARRPEVVEAIKNSISSVSGIRILDQHSDLDHNRTVFTFVGPPEEVAEAAYRGIARAAELIDLDQHSGEHPRIGAADVVPFIPISGASMEDCVELAQRLAERVGEQLEIPVYLYEEAAKRPERRNLEDIRRGQYEGLKESIASDPERKPDFGPSMMGKAGATVIGARPFLIAYNIYLTTDDVRIAKQIARSIRHSSGGLRYVKALGLPVDGRAQVSMNLTNFQKTPLARVVELIRREAARYGTSIDHSELVGLIPQQALEDAAVWHLQLDEFEPEQVIEKRIYASTQEEMVEGDATQSEVPVDRAFLTALASAKPTPGGGSASAYAAGMAAALVSMVARLTVGKQKYASVEEPMRQIDRRSIELQDELASAAVEDAAAFNEVMAALRLGKNTPQEKQLRAEQIQAATLQAAKVPLEVAEKAIEILKFTLELVAHGNLNAISDAGSAAALAYAALNGAALNVRVNALGLDDQGTADNLIKQIEQLEIQGSDLQKQIRDQITDRGGF
jgi:glutamate formiminotransferase/formiminotetrahydrofolate cyclodeaminase